MGQKTICLVEIDFKPRNFRHLTGVSYPGDSINFYREALNKKLDPMKIEFRPDGRTKSKLEILPLLVALPNTARMVGKYDNNGFKLHNDFLAGSVTGCMGFIQETNGKYAPQYGTQRGYPKDMYTSNFNNYCYVFQVEK